MEAKCCKFFVLRKKRNCRMMIRPGEQFCGEHAKDRITCPLDPHHTCDASELEKHMKKCPSKPPDKPEVYFLEGLNASNNELVKEKRINDVDDDVIQNLISRIRNLPISVRHDIRSHPLLAEEIGSNKHLKQISSILGHLSRCDSFDETTTFVELGSGRGQLTYWLTRTHPNGKYILVDKASHRHKFDNKLKNESKSVDVKRVRIDITDLDFKKLSDSEPVVGLSKHLCGEATDLALRGLTSSPCNIKGILIALCCHHRCTWSAYVGKDFFKKYFSPEEFSLICGLSSWATCGTGKPRAQGGGQVPDSKKFRLDLCREEREEIGRMSKRILDFGRLEFIREMCAQLSNTELIYYVDTDVSLENVLLFSSV